MDAELPYVPEQDAPGVGVYRNEIADLLHDYPVQSVPHAQTIANIAQIGSQFHILVLKTTMALPYTSVFIRLDCKYWSADAEQRLRARIGATPVMHCRFNKRRGIPHPLHLCYTRKGSPHAEVAKLADALA